MGTERLAHCPDCLAEYRWGVSVCTECGAQVIPGPSPAMEDDQSDAGDPDDLFAREGRPARVILCRIEEYEAAGLVDALNEEGIGARMAETHEDGTAGVIVHDTRLGEAQAIMVDYTGDPGLVDEVTFEGSEPTGEDDPGRRDGFVEVSSGPMSTVGLQADRLREEGIGVRVALPPEGENPTTVSGWGGVYVSREDLAEARHILGMEV